MGQHFLRDENVARKIAGSLQLQTLWENVLEIGPGTGALTKHLLPVYQKQLYVSEVDHESVKWLQTHMPELGERILEKDFLKINLRDHFDGQVAVIGNFPYNISSQILFSVLDQKEKVPEIVGMFQKEMAERIAEKPGTKAYGIISVLMQAYYDIEFLFSVSENVFVPPPKVKSAVIRLTRHTTNLDCNEKWFRTVVKTAFNQRRKTLRNSLKSLPFPPGITTAKIWSLRPETLSVSDFVALTKQLEDSA